MKNSVIDPHAANVPAIKHGTLSPAFESHVDGGHPNTPADAWRPSWLSDFPLRGTLAAPALKPGVTHFQCLEEMMERCKNVFEAILKYGHDEDWLPNPEAKFDSTDAPAGSPEKIEILRKRLELGLPLWHDSDRYDYNGLTGAIRPRESM